MRISSMIRVSGLFAVSLAVASAASAQYGGGGGTGTGTGGTGTGGTGTHYSYGSGKAIGIGVGAAAAAGVGIALLVHHHHKVAAANQASLVGCTQSVLDGLSLRNETDSATYTLLSAGNPLPAGARLELKGTVSDDRSGSRIFRVRSVVNNLGPCASTSATAKPESAAAPAAPVAATR